MSAASADPATCPRDGAPLVEVERSGVQIDACPSCRGIWLDRGELEKLIAKERAAAPDEDFLSEVTGRRGHASAEDDQPGKSDRKRKRAGFLEGFLDFGGE